MDFHLEFTPRPFESKIKHSDRLFLAGSCFTEQIGHKLAAHKFRIIDNPNGILFNPVSLAKSLTSYIEHKKYSAEDLFFKTNCGEAGIIIPALAIPTRRFACKK